MTWIAAIVLALAGFALAVAVFRISRALWASLLAALAMGLAGYALQASPNIPSALKADQPASEDQGFDSVTIRKQLLEDGEHSSADLMITADAFARKQRFKEAASLAAGITSNNPQDFEAWLALGNALVDHTDGALTPASLYAYRQAAELRAEHPAPGYFLGVSLIRQGRMMEARQVWTDTLAAAPEGHVGREIVAGQLGRLESMLEMAMQQQGDNVPVATTASPSE